MLQIGVYNVACRVMSEACVACAKHFDVIFALLYMRLAWYLLKVSCNTLYSLYISGAKP